MTRLLWILLRFSLCAWIGAAALFVVTGIREVTSDLFEPATKNQLAALRFPAFYVFGFTLVGIGTVASGILSLNRDDFRKRVVTIFVLSTIVLAIMVGDYFWIYTPLDELMAQPDARSNPDFAKYHALSKWINFASLSLCAFAAMLSVADRQPSTPASIGTSHE